MQGFYTNNAVSNLISKYLDGDEEKASALFYK